MFSAHFDRGIPWRLGRASIALSVLVLCLACVESAQAQQELGRTERRFRSRPMLIPGVQAPTAVVRSLAFTKLENGRVWLYSAGDDKFVRRWIFAGDPTGMRIEEAQKIVWPVFRDMRGVIYAMDAENFGGQSKVAFGGFGIKPSQVNVVDVAQPDLAERLLHKDLLARQAVWSMDMLNDGGECWLAVGYENTSQNRLAGKPAGLVPIWNISRPRNKRGGAGEIELVSERFNTVRFVAFDPTGRRLAMAGPDELGGVGQFALQIWDWRNSRLLSTRTINRQVTGLGWLDDATCLAGTVDGIEFSDSRPTALAGQYITAIRSGVPGQVALGVYRPSGEAPFAAGVWSPQQGFQALPGGDFVDPVTAICALDAGAAGSWIAAGGLRKSATAPSIQICVWKDGSLAAVAPDPQTAQRALAPIGQVHIDESGGETRAVAFAWGQRGAKQPVPGLDKQLVFGFGEDKLQPFDGRQPTDDGWFFATANKKRYLVNRGNQKEFLGPLVAPNDEAPLSYVRFKHRKTGRDLVAIGYNRGILVWDSSQMKETLRGIVRSFYGHAGPVTCLAASRDGDWLVSGSTDGSISAWSLEGVNTQVHDELGVRLTFDPQKRKYWVKADPSYPSVAWEAGFAFGQYITALSIGAEPQHAWNSLLGSARSANGGTEYFFKGLVPGREAFFTLERAQRNGPARVTVAMTTLSHDPLWTLYPCLNGEWCLTTPAGYYKKSNGMRDLQWLANLSPANEVSVDQSQQLATAKLWDELVFQDQLENIAKVDHVVQKRTAAELDSALLNAPVPPDFRFTVATKNGARAVTAHVSSRMASLALFVNGHAVGRAQNADQIAWKIDASKLRQGRNELVAAATRVVDGRQHTFLSKHPLPTPAPRRVRPTLHFVGIGVSEVVAHGTKKNLSCTAADVRAVNDALRKLADPAMARFEPGGVFEALTDERSTLAEFQTALRKLASQVRPDDLAFVMLAGHGVATPKSGGGAFQFLTRDATEGTAGTGISGDLLAKLLGQLNCRTVLLLDSCHSGSAPVNEQLANFFIRSEGPLIITACRGEQLAGEAGEHGLFTSSILRILGGNCKTRGFDESAARRDGALSVGEFYAFVRSHTQAIGGARGLKQDPMLFPSDNFADFASFVLRPLKAE